MDDDFDDIDDEDLLQALNAADPAPSLPAPRAVAPPVQKFQNPAVPQRPQAPPGYSRPGLPTTTQTPSSSRGPGFGSSSTTLQQTTTIQQSSRGGSFQNPAPFPTSSGGFSNTTVQNVEPPRPSQGIPSFPSSPLTSSGQQPSSSGRSFNMYHGIPQPGANGKMRQTTLYGGVGEAEASYTASGRQYRGEALEEPTHHELNREACKTWQYPMNPGEIREYQYSIVHASLFNNTLVALPTGLGKTLVAATVMLNFYRWTKTAKIVFIAPTRPLVSQQVSACFEIVGIPKSDTTILMGTVKPALRAQEWANRRVVFTTPQTLENDISRGFADPKAICLLVVDEAHRAVGNYSAAKACRRIMNFNKSFRVLALTATPGSSVESVQDVLNNLGIAKVEIRTEESLDLRQYTHQRNIDTRVVDYSDELACVRDLLTKALQPITKKLTEFNVYWGRDPMSLSSFTVSKARQDWMRSVGREVNQGVRGTVIAIFNILMAIAHPIKLLNFHGIIPFYNDIQELVKEVKSKSTKSKYKCSLVNDRNFAEMLENIETWKRDPDFVDHPKLAGLKEEVSNHFVTCDDPVNSKVIVFSEFRDSAEHITDILNRQPNIKARSFVGQAASKSGTGGMKQSEQIAAIDDFKKGLYNVLVATSIGEEGLDIGQVDLIVCYDSSASPIRMLQRMGRTGRKRAGRVVLLLTRGKEEEKYEKANDAYQNMQRLIASGETFEYRYDLSKRIIPREITPVVDKRFIQIPSENTQNPDNEVDPNKRPGAKTRKKAPPKKFYMPDGVITGFIKASAIPADGTILPTSKPYDETDETVDIPPYETVLLNQQDRDYFNRTYRSLSGRFASNVVVSEPDMNRFPQLQRVLRPTWKVRHSERTKKAVDLFKKLGDSQDPESRYLDKYDFQGVPDLCEIPVHPLVSEFGTPDPNPLDLPDSIPQKRTIDDLIGFDDDDIPLSEFELPDEPPPLPPIKAANVFPDPVFPRSDIGNNGDVIINQIPGRATMRRKAPVALLPSSPARLFNFLSDDEEVVEGRPRKRVAKGPSVRGKNRKAGGARGGRRSQVVKPKGFGDGEVGDDCEKTSDVYDSGREEDDGSDLADFIDDRDEEELEVVAEMSDDPFELSDSPKKKQQPATKKKKKKTSLNKGKEKRVSRLRAPTRAIPSSSSNSISRSGAVAVGRHAVVLSDSEEEMPSLTDILRKAKGGSGLPRVEVPEGRLVKGKEKEKVEDRREDYGLDEELEGDFDF